MSTLAAADRPTTPSRRWRIGPRTRKTLLAIHIIAAGAWIGIDVVLAVFVFTAFSTDDPSMAALAYQALEIVVAWPLLTAGLVCLASGVALGLGTKYGLLRYWWVAVKLLVNVLFVALVPLALQGTVAAAAAHTEIANTPLPVELARNLSFPPIVSPTGLVIAVLLAVFKPWGRIRKPRPAPQS